MGRPVLLLLLLLPPLARLVLVSLLLCLFGAFAEPENCTSCGPKVTPPSLVVKYGDRASATCTKLTNDTDVFGWESSQGAASTGGAEQTLAWEVENVTHWGMRPQCFTTDSEKQCCTYLELTVYQLPASVLFSVVSSGQNSSAETLAEGGRYRLRCRVQDVAPTRNLVVTFYRGRAALRTQAGGGGPETARGPETVDAAHDVTIQAEDDGAEFWCDARLDLGPQAPPQVESERFTATVLFRPRIRQTSDQIISITRTQGESLQLNCSASGSPAPLYAWTRPHHAPANGSAVFTVDHVATSDRGNYTCVAGNALGTDSITFHLDVNIDLLPIIAGVVAAAIVVAMAAGCVAFCSHYRQTKMGRYNLMRRIFTPRQGGGSDHVALPNGLSQSPG